MINKSIFLILVIVCTTGCFESKKSRNPSSIGSSGLSAGKAIKTLYKMEVVNGHKTSQIAVRTNNKKYQAQFKQGKNKSSKTLSKKDVAFLMKSFLAIKSPTNDIKFCRRNYIKVTTKNKVLLGCLSSPNTTSKKLIKTANLLNYYFKI